jgi:hypothetical protein
VRPTGPRALLRDAQSARVESGSRDGERVRQPSQAQRDRRVPPGVETRQSTADQLPAKSLRNEVVRLQHEIGALQHKLGIAEQALEQSRANCRDCWLLLRSLRSR